MSEVSEDAFVNRDDPIPIIRFDGAGSSSASGAPSQAGTGHESDHSDGEAPTPRRRGIRDRLSAFRDKASIQDKLVEKLLTQVLHDGGELPPEEPTKGKTGSLRTEKPNFSLPQMSYNFRRFNSRIGVVFVFQAKAGRLLSWKYPTHTLSFLAIYTFVCLDPYLLPLLPLAIMLFGVMIPNFIARHPAAPFSLSSEQAIGYSPQGPPLAPAKTVKPVKELSGAFFKNMRDLQNCMEDFSQVHDGVVALLVPRINFSDEALSSAISVFLFAGCLFMSIAANILPWRFIFLVIGWAVTVMGHPAVQKQIEGAQKKHLEPNQQTANSKLQNWIESDIILDSAPETREVEIFELQRLSDPDGEWEPWVFSSSPYDPLSALRITGDRPTGTRFFEDVRPPQGWEWSEKKWALDLWSREWVEERIITGVEVETEGERWVYDIYYEPEDRIGVVEGNKQATPPNGKAKAAPPRSGWEEGDDFEGRRGEWRRRRWIRLVKRKSLGAGQE
ncbi:integral peroxisomal membrane peroxin-domain-containing protein [Truncatella angustata]|uniref:Integral peroxisomal membrane peroxin-domain-containing protein n=1 Tax=Truncatella angustata TaxID=152316 RepID=A0A9P8UIM8_9PEZI|nr:integral peroxisomal membrane peroxin-domain-containing protein [Truncatella angustata]KAH6652869.1 integral peroxisomal membrane peroxin-domain-containing protein [Truncatella angustata]KAH8202279.1 hypothetical protein TruAng_003556 [Truncatella angustata]